MGLMGALHAGMSAHKILNQLSQAVPSFGPQIQQAAAAGYTAEQILGYLSKVEGGFSKIKAKKGERAIKPYPDEEINETSRNPYIRANKSQARPLSQRGNATERFLGNIGNVIGSAATALPAGAIGAAVGGSMGGPLGALAGGVGAATGINDAISRYQNYTREGGTGSFGEFLSGLAKSAGTGAMAGASAAGIYGLIKQLPQLLQNPQFANFFKQRPGGATAQQQQTAAGQMPPSQQPPTAGGGLAQPVSPQPTPNQPPGGATPSPQQTNAPVNFQKIINELGVGSQLMNVLKNNDPEVAAGYLSFKMTPSQKKWLKDQGITDVDQFSKDAVAYIVQQREEKNLTEREERIVPETVKPDQAKELKKDAASAVVRKVEYNPDEELLKVIFNNNAAYNYYDVPKDAWEKLSEGQASAKTAGQNEFGVWWVGKNPSVGASLNEYIKKPGYVYEKVGDESVTQEQVDAVIAEIKDAVSRYKEAPKGQREDLKEEINRLRQIEVNLRKAMKKKKD